MRVGPVLRHHATALLAGFIGGAAGWMFLDSTVSAQSDVIEASRVVVGDVVIANGQITFRESRRNDSFATLNMQGLTIRNGRGRDAQSASIRAGGVSVVTRYDERPDIFKRVDLEGGAIHYFPDYKESSTASGVETLDMDALFKRTRAEINALRNRRGRI